MDWYVFVKWMHVLSATVLFGTGMGTAFFMFRSRFTSDLQAKYYAARTTVLADWAFTTPAVVFQPLSGLWLVYEGGYSITETWLLMTYGLYVLAGVCWLPVVWIQYQLKREIETALTGDGVLAPRYYRLFRIWFLLGWPAFGGLLLVFWLMIAKSW